MSVLFRVFFLNYPITCCGLILASLRTSRSIIDLLLFSILIAFSYAEGRKIFLKITQLTWFAIRVIFYWRFWATGGARAPVAPRRIRSCCPSPVCNYDHLENVAPLRGKYSRFALAPRYWWRRWPAVPLVGRVRVRFNDLGKSICPIKPRTLRTENVRFVVRADHRFLT